MRLIRNLTYDEYPEGGYYFILDCNSNLKLSINIHDVTTFLGICVYNVQDVDNYLVQYWNEIKDCFHLAILGYYIESWDPVFSKTRGKVIHGKAVILLHDRKDKLIQQCNLEEILILAYAYDLLDRIHLTDQFLLCAKKTYMRIRSYSN